MQICFSLLHQLVLSASESEQSLLENIEIIVVNVFGALWENS